ncbi:MAG: DUF721 domain-containing protein [Desulfobacteraceae bacterium]|nr:DUF721 domain-containing protein [Desulfobacteraceae bacterium]MBC2754152.1 DUF721 domain-containing protein [Desulfobacteraceae bacterium]
MKNRRSKNSEYVHIKDVLSTVISNCRPEANSALSEIRETWNSELNKAITDNAQPTALKGGTLLITVKSSTLTHQLRFLTNDIIQAINRETAPHRITEIKFKTGSF